MSAWVDGDPDGGAEIARRAREMALRCGDAQDSGHCARRARARSSCGRDPDAGRDADARGNRRGGVDRLHRATGPRAQQPRRVRRSLLRITRSRTPTSRRRSSSAPRTTRICGTSTPWPTPRATPWTGAAGRRRPISPSVSCRTHASHPGRTTRRSSCSRSCVHGAAIRGRTLRSTRQRRVGVPAEDLDVHLDLASGAGRGRLARAARRTIVDAGDRACCLRRASGRGVAAGCARLSFWRRLAGLEVEAELDADRRRMRSRSPAGGRTRPPSGSAAPSRTRLRWR